MTSSENLKGAESEYAGCMAPGTVVKEYYVNTSDGVKLRVIDFVPKKDSPGKPVVLFVAGWISHIAGWKDVLREITPHFRTVYMETREKRSSVIPSLKVSFAMERLALDINEVIAETIPERRGFVMSGSSFGATAIFEYLVLGAREPLCSVLIAPIAHFNFPRFLGVVVPALPPRLYFIAKPIVKWYLRNFRLNVKAEAEQARKYDATLDAADPYKLKKSALSVRNYDVWDKLPLIKSPVLIIGAMHDTLHETEQDERIMRLLKRREYRELASNKETHSAKAGALIATFIEKKEYKGL
ncbi:MAG: alpha/beta hydrolase [Spirochaetes bacterium]|nr:MAG: alpha/beta hydrolase [Spirochaetota bacterium]